MEPLIRRPLPSRRTVLAAALVLPASGVAADSARPLEPHLRRTHPAGEGLSVFLTFDACGGGFDGRMARALVDGGVAATVFVSGVWLRANPEATAFLLARRDLFALENHGARHIPPVLGGRRVFGLTGARDLDAVRAEATAGAAAVRAACGAAPLWYRGATGFYSPGALTAIREMGLGVAAYSFSADDGASLPAPGVARRFAGVTNGSVIVAHINQPRRSSGAGAAMGIAALRARGVRFLRLDAYGPADFTYS